MDAAWWDRLAQNCALGAVLAAPQRVYGGYMHKMYRLDTASGVYAVKLLSPAVMVRSDAMDNFHQAESLERILQQYGLPVLAAMAFDGQKMQCLCGQYFYVFPWTDARAADWHGITPEQCKKAAQVLKRMHAIEQRPGQPPLEPAAYDWHAYMLFAQEKAPEFGDLISAHLGVLCDAQEKYNAALKLLEPVLCITDADMDAKNVLWENGEPIVIDLECLCFGSALWDASILCLSWAGGVVCAYDKARFLAFARAYFENGRLDAQVLFGAGFAWISWLAYNLDRALGLEAYDAQLCALSVQEVKNTLARIKYHAEHLDALAAWILEI